ncbi:ENV2 protein, partial [Atrichornis clamosus]|nr:ENV2 protein [Atrichornis clamosus]
LTGPEDLWKLITSSYHALNATNPNLTEHCWLCYNSKPPFYDAIAISGEGNKSDSINPAQCGWRKSLELRAGITLAQVTGSGTCIG